MEKRKLNILDGFTMHRTDKKQGQVLSSDPNKLQEVTFEPTPS